MSEIRFGSIPDGVRLALHVAFPPPVQIHSGDAGQEVRPGDFSVVMTDGTHVQELGRRYMRIAAVDVTCYPQNGNAECCAVADRLTGLLESITTLGGDVVHASSCEWAITDGALHVLASYRYFAYRAAEEAAMGELKIEQE